MDAMGTYLMGLDPEATPLRFAAARGLGTNRIADIELVDLRTGEGLDPERQRSPRVLMPVAGFSEGYYRRFRADGSVVPWQLDAVNKQRREDGLVPVLAA